MNKNISKKAIVNGKIYTANKKQPFAEALFVQGEYVSKAGSNDEIKSFIENDTEVIDLRGALVVPGLTDCHTHMVPGGFHLLNIDLTQVKSKSQFIEKVKKFKQERSPNRITGGSWNHYSWDVVELPTKEWVDEFTTDIPVFLMRMDYHIALANSKALEIAGITKETPDPDGGTIEKDKQTGEPTGILRDKAMELVKNILPKPTDDEIEKAANAALKEAARLGVTTVHDITDPEHFGIWQKFEREKKMTCRIFSRLPMRLYESVIRAGIEYGFGSDYLRTGSMKEFADGSLGAETALFHEPYQTGNKDNPGLAMDVVNDGRLEKWSHHCDKHKLQLSIHAIGDKANSLMLDLFEDISEANPAWDRRYRLEHAQHIRKQDLERFITLGVIASAQPMHLYEDGVWMKEALGEKRIPEAYPFKTMIEKNIHLCFGSDWPVVTLSPLMGIYAAVTRHTADGNNPDGFYPQEKITVQQAVDAYTIEAAYASFEEDIKGSLEPGKLADLVVLDKDIFEITPDEIKDTNITMTMVGGEAVYRK